MKNNQDILDKLREFRGRPELDPLKIRQEVLLAFASYEVLEQLDGKRLEITREFWTYTQPTEENARIMLIVLLKRAFTYVLDKNSAGVNRSMQMIEMVLWLLDDHEAFERVKGPYSFAYTMNVIQYLTDRYKDDSVQFS